MYFALYTSLCASCTLNLVSFRTKMKSYFLIYFFIKMHRRLLLGVHVRQYVAVRVPLTIIFARAQMVYNAFSMYNNILGFSVGSENNLKTENGAIELPPHHVSRSSYVTFVVTMRATRGPCVRCLRPRYCRHFLSRVVDVLCDFPVDGD